MSKSIIKDVTIRKSIEADAERFHELHTDSVRQLCSAVYSPEIIDGWLKHRTPGGYLEGIRRGEMYTAELDGKIIGFGHAVSGEILAAFVDPAYVRRGVGSMLVRHGIAMANVKAPGAIRLEGTLNARKFYETLGFRVTREIMVKRGNVEIPSYEMHRDGDK
jgi:ribosomal protein S18 acetylase RimI-like enzyme